MRAKLERYPLIVLLALSSFGCDRASEIGQKDGAISSTSEEVDTSVTHYDYRVIWIRGELFLKPLFNNSSAFGPFVMNEAQSGNFVHYPSERGRKNDFRTAQQLYRDMRTGEWLFTDNYLSMAPCMVDFPDSQDTK